MAEMRGSPSVERLAIQCQLALAEERIVATYDAKEAALKAWYAARAEAIVLSKKLEALE